MADFGHNNFPLTRIFICQKWEDRIQPGGQPNNEPTVRIPLSKYLDLLAKAKMGSEPKVVRTHAQRASEALARIGADASSFASLYSYLFCPKTPLTFSSRIITSIILKKK